MRPLNLLLITMLAASFLVACGPADTPTEVTDTSPPADEYDPERDYFSFANSDEFRVHHLELDLEVDFNQQELRGYAVLHLQRRVADADQVILDSRGLVIDEVAWVEGTEARKMLDFSMGGAHPVMGEPLSIELPPDARASDELQLRIRYRTGPEPSAIMWLAPETTAGGQYPFMFTQSQSIHARSWVPLQDTPAVRFTYEATIRTPPQLLALMSADNDPRTMRFGEYRFNMPQPIPSYLLALAVGNVYFAPFGDRTGVYAEPEVLEDAAWEFADTQDMLEAAEAIYGPYEWGRYDLLILPPSFPYGGMENPRLSFITPSVIAGDRSLVSLIAHELAHSWSGNLVSNRTWRDIWLNEGTTSYLEARLMEVLFGKDRADEERVLTYESLLEQLPQVAPDMQALAPRFDEGDPDVGQEGVEYAKGQLLLETLEARFGREVFDEFLAGYFQHFAWQAISSEQFLEYTDQHLLQAHPGIYSREELEAWLYQPGIPTSAQVPHSASLAAVEEQSAAWLAGSVTAPELPWRDWSPHGVVRFIRALPDELGSDRMAELDQALALSASNNAEIARSWFIEVAKRRFLPAYPAMEEHLARHGRTRLVAPVYKALANNGEDSELARSLFEANRNSYHPQTAAAIELALAPPAQ